MDPRTRDAIRRIPKALDDMQSQIDAMEEVVIGIYKLTRSTNESVVRKYGKKNTVKKVAKKLGDKVKGK